MGKKQEKIKKADYIVTGDKDLSYLKRYKSVRIIRASGFLKMFR